MNGKLTTVFVILCLGNIFGLAQAVDKKPVSNQLVLKIVSIKGKPASYHTVPEASAGPEGGFFSLFQKIPNWQLPAGELPVQSVNFVLRGVADAARITVSVYRGQKFHEKEEFVTVYTIHENQTIVVKELSKFGVEPFELSVSRPPPTVSVVPSVVNETVSLQATVEPNNSGLPSCRLKVLNNSSKAVSAFSFITTSNSAFQLAGFPQGFQGEPLIKPGEVYEDVFPSALPAEKGSDEQVSAAAPNLILTIDTVIFSDGTHEGAPGGANSFLTFTFGRKSQLKRVISVLQKAAENNFKVDELNRQLSNLKFEIDETAFKEFLKQLPAVGEREKPRLRSSAEAVANTVKKTILIDLKAFEAAQKNTEAITLQDWLKATTEKYQNWLARLSAVRP